MKDLNVNVNLQEIDDLRRALAIAAQNLRRAQNVVEKTLERVEELYYDACQQSGSVKNENGT